jgi:outer membrane protein OmpA-like peptidoglycan-associated protein
MRPLTADTSPAWAIVLSKLGSEQDPPPRDVPPDAVPGQPLHLAPGLPLRPAPLQPPEAKPFQPPEVEPLQPPEVEPYQPLDAAAAGKLATPARAIHEVLLFSPNQMLLSPAQLVTLDRVALRFMAQDPETLLIVEGHSDRTGPRAYNQRLSELRAAGVRVHLIEIGIEQKRISIRAYGSSRPAASDAAGGPSESRRVEFRTIRSHAN